MNKTEFKKAFIKAKKLYEKAQSAEQELFQKLEESYPNTNFEDIPSRAENADNIKEAILCYLQYGEYSSEEIWEEIKQLN